VSRDLYPLFAFVLATGISAACLAVDEPPDPWTDADEEASTAAVNEGGLRLLTADAASGTHAHENRIAIRPQSLLDGWVGLDQCHRALDAVPAAQVVFQPGRIREIRVTRSEEIGRAWVAEHSVQIEDVGQDAVLCIHAESLALRDLEQGRFRLRTGPYMRRFLDGYYPMRLSLHVEHPQTLRLMGQHPQLQPGLGIRVAEGRLHLDATFDGRLIVCLDFCATDQGACAPITLECDPRDGGVP
jgi:hypothetical protein